LTLDIRFTRLYISNINNVNIRYELLYNTEINDKVKFNKKIKTLRDTILSIQYKRLALFTGVEQGSGQNMKNVFVLMTPRLRRVAQQ
jgi:hypothetical protein